MMALNFFLLIILHRRRVGWGWTRSSMITVLFSQARPVLRLLMVLLYTAIYAGSQCFLVFGRVPGVALQRSWDTVTVSGSATAAFHG